jgi:hypothetical protein
MSTAAFSFMARKSRTHGIGRQLFLEPNVEASMPPQRSTSRNRGR